jgi:hypothetical protein
MHGINEFEPLLGDPWGSTALINRFLGVDWRYNFPRFENQSAQMALQRAELARVTRLMTLGELTTSIALEVNQPLAAVVPTGMPACAGS